MRFKEYLSNLENSKKYVRQTFAEDGKIFHFYTSADSLDEAKWVELGKGNSVRYDSGNTGTKTKGHLHFLHKGKDLITINRDGIAHDQSHGYKMSKRQTNIVSSKFGFSVPDDNILESCTLANELLLLCKEIHFS